MASDVPTVESTPTDSLVRSVAIFVSGASVGAIAALLLTPQTGRESRKQLSTYGRRTGETMREWATAASDLFATGEKVREAAPLEARGGKATGLM
jgi:hypothetical protein